MTPDKVQARKMVLVSTFLLAAIAIYRDRQGGGEDTFRALWGVGVVGMVLATLADFLPQIAGPFAALTVLGSLTAGGDSIIQRMLGTIAVTPSPAAAAHPDSRGGTRGPGAAAPAAVPSPTTIRGGN